MSRALAATPLGVRHRRLSRPQLALAFARVLSVDGRALVLTRENDLDSRTDLAHAALLERAFAVAVAPDVLALDFDGGNRAAFFTYARTLTEAGIATVLVESGQRGRYHLFARIGDGARRATFAAAAKAHGFDVRHTIRPPFAPHRLGGHSRIIEPTDPLEALARLQLPPRRRRQLSARMRDLLLHGDSAQRYRSRSEADCALLVAMHGAGWTFEAARDALLDPVQVGSTKAKAMHPKNADAYLRRTWAQAARWRISTGDRPDAARARREIETFAQKVAITPWPGRRGPMARALLLALAGIAHGARKVTFTASTRTIAEHANCTSKTVMRHMPALVAAGWLHRTRYRRGATTWTLACQTPGTRVPINLTPTGGV